MNHPQPAHSDVLFTGGWIYTGDEDAPFWGSVAVRDGKILAVEAGQAPAAELALPGARIVDLAGRMLLPGFQDAHLHPIAAGMEMLGCDLSGSNSAEEALATIAAYAAAHPQLDWITGAGWSMDAFDGGTPTRALLDKIVPDRPVLLENRDHHSAWVNTRALELAGFDASTPDPPDGRFEREPDGFPAGTVHDGAIFLFEHVRPSVSEDQAYAGLRAAQERMFSLGVTGWQDAAVGKLMGQPDTLPVYLRALEQGTLLARVRGAQWWDRTSGIAQLDEIVARQRRVAARFAKQQFSLGSVKIMVDGVAESRTAAMHGCYRDAHGEATASNGMTFFDREELAQFVTAIDAAGLQVHFHALGDRAVTDALDALEAARQANGDTGLRHHLAHLELVRESDLRRFAKLGATANLQPLWAAHDAQLDTLVLPFLPEGAQAGLYPFASLAAAGAHLAMGSDWPVSSPDPLQAIHVGVNRSHPRPATRGAQALAATPPPEFRPTLPPALHPSDALSLAQLLNAATSGTAHVNHLDEVCSRLRPGMLADFAILDKNLFDLEPEDLHTARVDETWIGGERVYARS